MNERTDLRNILIICLQGIGNTLMALYAAEKLVKVYPGRLSMVVSNNGSHELALSQFPDSKVYIWDECKSSAKNIVRLGWELRDAEFEEVFLAYPSGKREGVIGLLARAKEKKVLLDGKGDWKSFRKLYKSTMIKPSNIHDITGNLLLFGVENRRVSGSERCVLDIVKRNYDAYGEEFVVKNNLSNKLIIAVHPGATGEGKRWASGNYIILCKEISKRFDCRFVIIGGNDELLLKQTIANGVGESAVLLNATSFYQTASVLKKCNLFIGNDSAPMHLSVTLGVPVIALWSYTDFCRTSPYGGGNVIIRKPYECSPCYSLLKPYISDCKYSMRCIRNLAVEEVLPVVFQCIEIMLSQKRNVSAEDINSLKMDHIERIYKLEHGCIVIDLRA